MDPGSQNAFTSPDHIVDFGSPVADSDPSQLKLTSSFSISGEPVDREPAVVDTSSTHLGWFWNMKQFEKLIEIGVVVVTQMYGSSEKQKNIFLGLLASILAVCALEFWVMTGKNIILGIAFNFAKLLCFYLLLCILKPGWLSWCGIVMVCSIAIAYTFSDELKTKFTWSCDKVLKIIRKDQVSPPTDSTTPDRAPVPPV